MIPSKYLVEEGYYDLTPEHKSQICNGAGAANDWRSAVIPNTIYGLDCSHVFDIHDYAYHVGITAEDKCIADISMLVNLIKYINDQGGWLNVLRRYRAVTYYQAVHELGEDAFFTAVKGNLSEIPEE